MRKTRIHRALGVAALWLALVAMVFAYTDPEAFSWRYEDGEIPLIWESAAQADDAQAQAERRIKERRQEISDRQAAGNWAETEAYEAEANVMLPAREEDEPGLNLMWGDYEAAVEYASDAPINVRVAAAGRQAFVKEGTATLPAAPQGAEGALAFTLTDAAPGVMLAGDLPQGARIVSVRVRKAGAGVFSRDLAAYALLAGCVLTALLALRWDESAAGRERRRDAMILVCAALFASLPSLTGMLRGGHDLFFHLNRIEGIAAGLRAGEFPVRIHSSTLLSYGYAAPQFYPELFLYIPAIMRNLGVSQVACLIVCQMGVNLLAALSCYAGARRLFGSRRVAVGAAALYTLSIYRVANLYVRASLGESVAMAFMPLLIAALCDVLVGDERRWPVLSLAMLGVFMSHLLSTLFCAGLCAVAAVFALPRLIRQPKRLLAILKAAALTALCSLWFIVPFLDYSAAGISTNVQFESAQNMLSLGSLLIPFSGNPAPGLIEDLDFAIHIGTVPGAAILAGCALLLARMYARGARGERLSLTDEPGRDRLALFLLALGAVALLCATPLFPWSRVTVMRKPISSFFMLIQFPWRLAGVATPLLALAAARGYLAEERHASAGMAALLALSVVFCGYTLTTIASREPAFDADFFCDTRLEQSEYLYIGTYKETLEAGRIAPNDDSVGIEVLSYEKKGTTLEATLRLQKGCAYFEMPMLYYPGYRVSVNGVAGEAKRGANNVIRILNTTEELDAVSLRVWFEPPVRWLIAQGASLAGALLLCAALLRGRRRGA